MEIGLDADVEFTGPATNHMLLRPAISAGFSTSVKPRIPV
jgi:hypothetical protein